MCIRGSINTLTLFGIVLAIGVLVDDAIVVVENVERLMHEEGLSPIEATRKSMDTISGALIGVAAVLAAMFVPMAFFGGTQGVIYRQFSVTLISAMGLSVIVALVLTPPLCAQILKPQAVSYTHLDVYKRQSVFLVGPDNKAIKTPIELGEMIGDKWQIISGLKIGDKLILQGGAKLKQGAPIKPKPVENPNAPQTDKKGQ